MEKGIQDSLGFWIPRRGVRIPGTAFQSLSVELWAIYGLVELEFSIPWGVFPIPMSMIQDSGFHAQNLPKGRTDQWSCRVVASIYVLYIILSAFNAFYGDSTMNKQGRLVL